MLPTLDRDPISEESLAHLHVTGSAQRSLTSFHSQGKSIDLLFKLTHTVSI